MEFVGQKFWILREMYGATWIKCILVNEFESTGSVCDIELSRKHCAVPKVSVK